MMRERSDFGGMPREGLLLSSVKMLPMSLYTTLFVFSFKSKFYV